MARRHVEIVKYKRISTPELSGSSCSVLKATVLLKCQEHEHRGMWREGVSCREWSQQSPPACGLTHLSRWTAGEGAGEHKLQEQSDVTERGFQSVLAPALPSFCRLLGQILLRLPCSRKDDFPVFQNCKYFNMAQ